MLCLNLGEAAEKRKAAAKGKAKAKAKAKRKAKTKAGQGEVKREGVFAALAAKAEEGLEDDGDDDALDSEENLEEEYKDLDGESMDEEMEAAVNG